ncbi:MAG: recombination regulator RecX [Gammaproteobacteria bacterium]|nr:recombination regulator RecX [Gammaproteobacteria bacterium]MCH9744299.1 recombination regulator RecX [Gammaproteobacteria bacterium]
MAPQKSLRHRALDLLSAREHSAQELRRKLIGKGFDADDIAPLIETLQQENLLNDQRFAESYVHYRSQSGYGPVRIRAELRQRGVADELIDDSLYNSELDWPEILQNVWQKKYGSIDQPLDARERAKRMRFLYQRGFDAELMTRVMADDD